MGIPPGACVWNTIFIFFPFKTRLLSCVSIDIFSSEMLLQGLKMFLPEHKRFLPLRCLPELRMIFLFPSLLLYKKTSFFGGILEKLTIFPVGCLPETAWFRKDKHFCRFSVRNVAFIINILVVVVVYFTSGKKQEARLKNVS
jgi:hypothetical protein